MPNKTLLDSLSDPIYAYFRPPQKLVPSGVGTFYSPVIPANVSDVNVYEYHGPKETHFHDTNDEGEEEFDADPGARRNKKGITFSNTDSEEENLTLNEAEMCTWEALPGQEGWWTTKIACPSELVRLFTSPKSMTLRNFHREFPDVSVKFPDQRNVSKKPSARRAKAEESSQIQLSHRSNRKTLVRSCQFWLDEMAENINKLPYTHFISLPFLAEENLELCTRFAQFRAKLRELNVDERLIQLPQLLHYTLCMLRLYTQDSINKAIAIINRLPKHPSLYELFSSERPPDAPIEIELPAKGLSVQLKGLHVFQEEETQSRVVYTCEAPGQSTCITNQQSYTPPTPWLGIRRSASSYINQLAEVFFQELLDAELLDIPEMNRQKLLDPTGKLDLRYHMTLVSASYSAKANTFDASEILKKLKDFDFGVGVISALHLSQRGGAAIDTRYYTAEVVLPLRPNLGL